jgi:dTDP-glucose 4,6-dehydratase
MRLLLTGSAGFLGRHLWERITEATDWTTIGLDINHHPAVKLMPWARFQPFQFALDSSWGWDRSELHDIDFMIGAAARVEPEACIEANVKIQTGALELARSLKPRVFLHISTNEVYGPANGAPHKEWDTMLPGNPYAAGKAAQEAIAIAYWRSYGVPLVIVNTQNLIGEYQQGGKFIPTCIRQIKAGEAVRVYPGLRKWLDAHAFADALLFILRGTPAMNGRPDRFHVVGESMVNERVAEIVADELAMPLKIKREESTRPGHDGNYDLDGSKLEALGWKPAEPLETSIRRIVRALA